MINNYIKLNIPIKPFTLQSFLVCLAIASTPLAAMEQSSNLWENGIQHITKFCNLRTYLALKMTSHHSRYVSSYEVPVSIDKRCTNTQWIAQNLCSHPLPQEVQTAINEIRNKRNYGHFDKINRKLDSLNHNANDPSAVPLIVFIDQEEKRSDETNEGNHIFNQYLAEMLAQMDNKQNVIFVGTTNHTQLGKQ